MVSYKIVSFLCGKDISLSANNNLKNPLSELNMYCLGSADGY